MGTASLPRGASTALVVGLAAAAIAVLSAVGGAPGWSRAGSAVRPEGRPQIEEAALASDPPVADMRGATASVGRQDSPGAAEADPPPPSRQDDPGRGGPAASVRAGRSRAAAAAAAPRGPTAPGAELQPSRSEVTVIEQQPATARADGRLGLQQDLADEVAAMRALLAQQQARRDAESAAAQERVARTEGAVNALLVAQGRLAAGDARVLDLLDDASPALPVPAQGAVQRARSALESEDLYQARRWLAVAVTVTEAQRVQLGP
jgi:hypothetical protein